MFFFDALGDWIGVKLETGTGEVFRALNEWENEELLENREESNFGIPQLKQCQEVLCSPW